MHGSGSDGTPNLTPLLDVVLQLIMFFMITVNFVRVEQIDDGVDLPTVHQARPLERTANRFVFISLNEDGEIYLERWLPLTAGSEARLTAFLQREKQQLEAEAADKGVFDIKVSGVVRGDANTEYNYVYKVLDAMQRANYHTYQLRVQTTRRK